MFDNNSTIVHSWVELIRNGHRKREQIPVFFNLAEIVHKILDQECKDITSQKRWE